MLTFDGPKRHSTRRAKPRPHVCVEITGALVSGAAATAVAAAPRVFAQQTGQDAAAVSFYEKGAVRIHFEEAGSGFPLLLIAGGGLNSTILRPHPQFAV